MKKITAIILSLALISALFCGFSITSMAAEEPNYVQFTASGNDPYCTLAFKDDAKINPDNVKYAAIRYRGAASLKDSGGNDYCGQFYITPAKEPSVPITYSFTGDWATTVVDCTKVIEGVTDPSVWTSAEYKNSDTIRFDPLESLTRKKTGNKDLVVNTGDSIDVAWIAFFENEADAKAYTGKESTPAAVIDPDTMYSSIKGANNVALKVVKDGQVEKESLDPAKIRYLYNKDTLSTGWWLVSTEASPVAEESQITVEAPIDHWFNAIMFFAYASANNVQMYLEIECDGHTVFEKEFTAYSNSGYTIEIGKALKPGDYTFYFITGDNSELGNWHFVLGSGDAPEGVDPEDDTVITMGGNTNGDTKLRPAIGLYECDAVEEEATPQPTAVPTEDPAASTPVPTTVPTAAPTPEPKNKGCGSMIGTSALAVLCAATVVIRKKED